MSTRSSPSVREAADGLQRPGGRPVPATTSHLDIAAYRSLLKASNRATSTIMLRTSQLRRLAEAYPRKPLRSLTAHDLIAFFAARDWGTASAYSFRATLKDFYAMLLRDGHVKKNVAHDVPRITVRNRAMMPAPESAVVDRVDLDERTRLLVELGARQGLRRGEIACIHLRDLVRDGDRWVLVVHGKGNKDRVIPLHDDLAVRIRAAARGWLLPSPRGGHLTASHVGHMIVKALPEGWSTHSLRRRFATKIYTETKDLRAVQQLLGHGSLDVTQRYIGSRPESLREALRHA